MIIKIFCALTIILSCSYIGIKLSGSLSQRVRTLSGILSAVSKIESCISTVRMPLNEIYSTLALKEGPVGEFFSKVSPGSDWKKHIHLLPGLTSQDKSLIIGLSEKLGSFETERQLDELRLAQSLLHSAYTQAKSDVADNSRVYRAMSFFTGVVIAILLI